LEFLRRGKEVINKQSQFSLFLDPYEEWILKRDPPPNPDLLFQSWHALWGEVFSPLLEEEREDYVKL